MDSDGPFDQRAPSIRQRDVDGPAIVRGSAAGEQAAPLQPRHQPAQRGLLWGVPTAPRLRMFIVEIAPAVKERVAEVRAERA